MNPYIGQLTGFAKFGVKSLWTSSTLVVLMEQPPFVPQGTKVGFTDETSMLGKHHPEENLLWLPNYSTILLMDTIIDQMIWVSICHWLKWCNHSGNWDRILFINRISLRNRKIQVFWPSTLQWSDTITREGVFRRSFSHFGPPGRTLLRCWEN